MPSSKQQLKENLMPLLPAIKEVVYETGPTGYGLARFLHKQSIPASVIATSKIPTTPGHEDKTDKLDSKKLAYTLLKGC